MQHQLTNMVYVLTDPNSSLFVNEFLHNGYQIQSKFFFVFINNSCIAVAFWGLQE